MSQQVIGQGPGNLVPDSEVKQYFSGAAIAVGQSVGISGTTGYTVAPCNVTTIPGFGVALTAASAAGEWIDVCVSGYCALATNDGTDVVLGDLLYSGAAGTVTPLVNGAAQTLVAGGLIGMANASETGTSCVGITVFKKL